MCAGGELIAELLAPGSTARRIWRWLYYLALVAIFTYGAYLAYDSGLLISQ